jgi:hypothetical protein
MSTLPEILPTSDSAIKALIIYTDFLSAAKANATLECSAKNLHFSMHWDIRPWRVDLLRFPSTAQEAWTEAIDAHLIVLAGRHAHWLPLWLQNWLEHWATSRRVEAAALAVIGVEPSAAPSTIASLNVQVFAQSHGLTLMFDDSRAAEELPLRPVEFMPITPPGAGPPPKYQISPIQTNQQLPNQTKIKPKRKENKI